MLGIARAISRRLLYTGRMPPANPIIAVIGATGTGKSQLAIELASQFNGEVINCDAMQMYAGLPIITNKVTPEEQRGIPHHLLGCIGLEEPTWTVSQFVIQASRTIDEIQQRGKLPVLVGGTHYYMQALLVKESILDQAEPSIQHPALQILEEPTELLLEKLKEVDPVMAERWHPNERRKIQRSLEIWLRTGRRASDIYDDQHRSLSNDLSSKAISTVDSQGAKGSNLRFDALIFWLHAAKDVLRSRLDKRVLKMVEAGLVSEVQSMYDFKSQKEAHGQQIDVTRGIWASIGFKEFAQFETAVGSGEQENQVQSLKEEAIDRTQSATRRYAKRQIRWIQSKFVNALTRSNAIPNLFLLDGSDLEQWIHKVRKPAGHITEDFLLGAPLPDPQEVCELAQEMLTSKGEDLALSRHQWQKKVCEACGITAVTLKDWDLHLQSNRHKKVLAGIAKRKRLETRLSVTSTG